MTEHKQKRETTMHQKIEKHTAQHGNAQIVIFGMQCRSVKGYQVFGPGGDLLSASNDVKTLLQIKVDLAAAMEKPTQGPGWTISGPSPIEKRALLSAIAYVEYLQSLTED